MICGLKARVERKGKHSVRVPWLLSLLSGVALFAAAATASGNGPLTLPRGYAEGRFTYGDASCTDNRYEDPLNVVFYGTEDGAAKRSVTAAAINTMTAYAYGNDNSKYQNNEGGSDAWARDYSYIRNGIGSMYLCAPMNSNQLGTGSNIENRNHVRFFEQALRDCSPQPYLDQQPFGNGCRQETSLDAHFDYNVPANPFGVGPLGCNSSSAAPAKHIASDFNGPRDAIANSLYGVTTASGRHRFVVHWVHRGQAGHKHQCTGRDTAYGRDQAWVHLPYDATH